MARIVNIADLRAAAQARLPRVVFDYLDGAAEDEVTARDNVRAFDDIVFRPRNAVASPSPDLSVTLLGQKLSMPLLLAPVGYSRLMHPRGELAAAAGAGRAGIGYILSTNSGHALEKVRAQSAGPLFYQLYLMGGRAAAEAAIARAKAAGYAGLFVTVDTAVAGFRERDVRNGMGPLLCGNLFERLPYLPGICAHPRWLIRFLLDGGIYPLPNVVIPGVGPMKLVDVNAGLAAAQVTWADLKWIRDAWNGPLVVKGVLTAEDARRAVDAGAAGVVVSNHGGRQLDGVSSAIRALPPIADAVGERCEVLMDSGIRRGADIVKALCLGAKAVLAGRGYAYGMAAAGDAGVDRALAIFRADMLRTLSLLGCADIAALERSRVGLRDGFANP